MSHALVRMRERYGSDLTRHDLAVIVQQIRSGQIPPRYEGGKGSHTAIYLVPHGSQRIKVVYSLRHDVIVTALPLKGSKPRRRTIVRNGHRYER